MRFSRRCAIQIDVYLTFTTVYNDRLTDDDNKDDDVDSSKSRICCVFIVKMQQCLIIAGYCFVVWLQKIIKTAANVHGQSAMLHTSHYIQNNTSPRENGGVQGARCYGNGSGSSRTLFSRAQLDAMENRFMRQSFLTREERIELAEEIQLSERQILIWFQNRR